MKGRGSWDGGVALKQGGIGRREEQAGRDFNTKRDSLDERLEIWNFQSEYCLG